MAIKMSRAEAEKERKLMKERAKMDEESGKKPERPLIGNHTPGKTRPKAGKK